MRQLKMLLETDVVGAIKKDDRVNILETNLLTDYPLLDFVEETSSRLAEGAKRYGTSWTQVDLKTDLMEELYDCLNYPRMILTRMKLLDHPRLYETEMVIAGIVGDLQRITAAVEELVPEFEGYTNNDFIAAKEDDQ